MDYILHYVFVRSAGSDEMEFKHLIDMLDAAVDKKESSIHEQLQKLNSSNELVEAVKKGDIALAK